MKLSFSVASGSGNVKNTVSRMPVQPVCGWIRIFPTFKDIMYVSRHLDEDASRQWEEVQRPRPPLRPAEFQMEAAGPWHEN